MSVRTQTAWVVSPCSCEKGLATVCRSSWLTLQRRSSDEANTVNRKPKDVDYGVLCSGIAALKASLHVVKHRLLRGGALVLYSVHSSM